MRHGAAVDHILEATFWIEAESFRDRSDTLRPKVSFCIHVKHLPLPSSQVVSKLWRYAERMAELCLAGAEFTKELRNGLRLDAASK